MPFLNLKSIKPVLFCIAGLLSAGTNAVEANTEQQQKLDEFVKYAVEQHQLDATFVRTALQQARKNKTVLNAIARPWEAKPWYKYHPIFLTEKRISKGVEFWQKHREILNRAERELGVPAEIIVAIIGVETFYGSYVGKYKVIDSLYSLSFYYPPRSQFFKKELAEYLKLVKEEQWQLGSQKGSYAGAMGWGQFISSSYRHYAIDFDLDGKRDILNNPVDAIGSVGNYFKAHHWTPGAPVAYKANAEKQAVEHLVEKDLKIKNSWQALSQAGVKIKNNIQLDPEQKAKLLVLAQQNNEEYWVVLPNFYVITRYNHSPLYAMVVHQLSQSLKQRMESQ